MMYLTVRRPASPNDIMRSNLLSARDSSCQSICGVARIHWTVGHVKNERARHCEFRLCIGIKGEVEWTLGQRHVAGPRNETGEVGVGDRVNIDPKTAYRDEVCGSLLGIVAIGAHSERASADPPHPLPARFFGSPCEILAFCSLAEVTGGRRTLRFTASIAEERRAGPVPRYHSRPAGLRTSESTIFTRSLPLQE
jgi:hypothetical protein